MGDRKVGWLLLGLVHPEEEKNVDYAPLEQVLDRDCMKRAQTLAVRFNRALTRKTRVRFPEQLYCNVILCVCVSWFLLFFCWLCAH